MRKFGWLVMLAIVFGLISNTAQASDNATDSASDVAKAVVVYMEVDKVGEVKFYQYNQQGMTTYTVAPQDEQKVELTPEAYLQIDAFLVQNHEKNVPSQPVAPNQVQRDVTRSHQQWLNNTLSSTWMRTTIIQYTVNIGLRSTGTYSGYWLASAGVPNSITLQSQLCYDGIAISFTLPIGFQVYGDCGTYSSPWCMTFSPLDLWSKQKRARTRGRAVFVMRASAAVAAV